MRVFHPFDCNYTNNTLIEVFKVVHNIIVLLAEHML